MDKNEKKARELPGDLKWKLDTLRPGSCGFVSLTAEEWDYVRGALDQQPATPSNYRAAVHDGGSFSSDTAALAFLALIGNGNPNVNHAVERLRTSLITSQQPEDLSKLQADAEREYMARDFYADAREGKVAWPGETLPAQQPAHPLGTPMMPPGKFHNALWKSLPVGVQHYARILTQSWATSDSTELKNALEAAVLSLSQQPAIPDGVICPNCERMTAIHHCQACGCDFTQEPDHD